MGWVKRVKMNEREYQKARAEIYAEEAREWIDGHGDDVSFDKFLTTLRLRRAAESDWRKAWESALANPEGASPRTVKKRKDQPRDPETHLFLRKDSV